MDTPYGGWIADGPAIIEKHRRVNDVCRPYSTNVISYDGQIFLEKTVFVRPGYPPSALECRLFKLVLVGFLRADQRETRVGRSRLKASWRKVPRMAASPQFGSDLDASLPGLFGPG